MKLKSWMEAHIVLHTKWKKKEKRKKTSEVKNQTSPATTLPSWRTSNFLHFFTTNSAVSSRRSKTLPESREKDGKPQQQVECSFVPTALSSNNTGHDTQTPPFVDDNRSCDSSFVLRVHLAEQLDSANLNSPRQRNKIRTNPWLTPKQQQKAFPNSSSSGSDGSALPWDPADAWRSSYLSSTTAESSRDSPTPSSTPVLAIGRSPSMFRSSAASNVFGPLNHRYRQGGEPCIGAKQATSTLEREPQNRISGKTESNFVIDRGALLQDPGEVWRSSYLSSTTTEDSLDSYNGPIAAKRETPKRISGKAENDSDSSEECETLNEMGNFDEHYEYDWETAESDILGDFRDPCGRLNNRRRPSRRRGCAGINQTPVPCKWRDLRSDEDYSERLEYADEAYSEMSGGSAESGLSDGDEGEKRERSPEADSAFPSESEELSSTATTPLMEGIGVAGGGASSSGSDSGIQRHEVSGLEPIRSLRGIRDSLEDKVRNLRIERLVVEDKIREAMEEDSERRAEKEHFRKELVLHRRQVLLRTLDQLRNKLEDQSTRLQEAYHSTLEMQLGSRRQLATVAEENTVSIFGRMALMHEKLL